MSKNVEGFGTLLAQALHQAQARETQGEAVPLNQEAQAHLLMEVVETYDSNHEDQPEVGDIVVQRDYMDTHAYPNDKVLGVLYKVWDNPMQGKDLMEGNCAYALEVYDCTVAVLHPTKEGATLVFVPMNLRRLKRKDVTADTAAD